MLSLRAATFGIEPLPFLNQMTYYFGTKEALFVEAACREMLYVARDTWPATPRPPRWSVTWGGLSQDHGA